MPGPASPSASVIIPTYNRAALLPATIASVTRQSVDDLEVVVVDDGSTDTTADVVAGLRDRRIRYLYQANAGRSAARNAGFQASTGRYVTFLDSDDRLLPGALERGLGVLDRQPDVDWVAGGILFSTPDGRVLGENRPWTTHPRLTLADLVQACPMAPSSVLMRRSTFASSTGFDKQVETAEDWDLWIRLARSGHRFAWLQAPVCRYRVHAGNSVADGARHAAALIAVLDKLFATPDLPADVAALADRARAIAYVRGACLEYASGQTEDAQLALERAVALDSTWLANRGQHLLEWLVAGAASPFVPDPQRFLDTLFANLPVATAVLRQRRREARGLAAMAAFYRAHAQGRRSGVGTAFARAVLADPRWLRNRGAVRTCLEMLVGRRLTAPLRAVVGGQHHARPEAVS